jgi:hypothetical protein
LFPEAPLFNEQDLLDSFSTLWNAHSFNCVARVFSAMGVDDPATTIPEGRVNLKK